SSNAAVHTLAQRNSSTVLERDRQGQLRNTTTRNTEARFKDFWHSCRWRRVTTSLCTHNAVNNHHSDPRQVTALHAVEHVLTRRMLSPVEQHEGGGPAAGNESAV